MLKTEWISLLDAAALSVLAVLSLVYITTLWTRFQLRGRQRVNKGGPGPIDRWPLVSVLVPAHNEERVIAATLRSLLQSDYPTFEVIVIDDGSSDRTAHIVADIAKADARVQLLTQPRNLGKAHALNAGIALARADHLVIVDADTVTDPHFLEYITAPLIGESADAVAGNVKVGNRQHGHVVVKLQSIEYVCVLNAIRASQDRSNMITTIPGAAGAMRRSAVQSIGAYSASTRAEDADLTLRLVNMGYRVRYEPRAIARTEAPETWRVLFHQRVRWLYGNMQCIQQNHRSRRLLYASAPFVYENVWKPPLEFARALTPMLLPISNQPQLLVGGYLLLLLLSWVAAALTYADEHEDRSDALYVPIYYVLWPIFIIFPYSIAAYHFLTRRGVKWRKAARTGGAITATMQQRRED
jgi:cellulose synthase/poly-beta-1,6-N-acetylglucosamine synthase-like glycosyltransferase